MFISRLFQVILSVLLLLGLWGTVSVVPAQETLDELRTVKEQISRARRGEAKARSEQLTVLQEIDDLNRRHAALQNELEGLSQEMEAVLAAVSEQEAEALRLRENLRQLRLEFKRRLRIRYCQAPGKWLDFLCEEADLLEKLNALVYGRRVLAADRRLWASCEHLLREVETRQLDIEKRRFFLLELKARESLKLGELEENIAKKNELLYKIKHQVKSHQELVAELEGVAADLERMTRSVAPEKTDFAALRGNLPMPVDGVVVSFFGLEKDSRFATVTSNRGIEIEAPLGAPVKVVYAGQVVFASWMKGYGNLLVVDHGGGFFSIYAYLEEFNCQIEDRLQGSEIIGRVGRGGISNEPALYFEIRRDGVPEDPLTWVSDMASSIGSLPGPSGYNGKKYT
ncbi:MAG: peptidoglycan DD-metalloendopeptidase family protein [Deltaproteobacteria bacterium]|nr:peptidoglycan DD-metalloendopeptidase family protein [Deltaproteobacteria bacterium]